MKRISGDIVRRFSPLLLAAIAPLIPQIASADATYQTITNYQGDIISSPLVTAWYGQRVALVIDGQTAAQAAAMDMPTMTKIVTSFDNLFTTYDQITGFDNLPIGKPLNGKITIECSPQIGGGGANHGVLGIAVGDGFFTGLYNRVLSGQNTYDQVFFYESQRNYWIVTMQNIDAATSTNPDSWGWWTVAFNNAMAVLAPQAPISGISDMYYFGENGAQFAAPALGYLNTYINNPQYTWANSWDVDRLPWNTNVSVNDLETGLILQLAQDHGGTSLISGLYHEIPRVPDLANDHADDQGARDNFYIAASRAAGVDLRSYFTNTLRWQISPDADANYSRWTGGASGRWDNNANWVALTSTAYPNASTVDVAIDGSTQTNIDLHGNRSVKSLRFDGLTAASFTLSNSVSGAQLTIANGGSISKDINTFIGMQTIAAPITLAGSATISNNSSWNNGNNELLITGKITGTGALHLNGRNYQLPGDGGIELTAANTGYTGTLYLDGGRLIVANNNALGSGNAPVVINAGDIWFRDGISTAKTLTIAGTSTGATLGATTLSGPISIADGATWTITQAPAALNFNGAITGSGNVTLQAGNITYGGSSNNTLSGMTTIKPTDGNYANDVVLLSKTNGAAAINGPVTLSNNAFLRLTANNQLTSAALITCIGSYYHLQLNGFSTPIGGLQGLNNQGVVENESGAANTGTLTIGDSTNSVYVYNGTLRNGDFHGIDGTLALVKSGTNTQSFTWQNTYTGTTTIAGGAIRGHDNWGLPLTSNLILNGGVFEGDTGAAFSRKLGTAAGQIQWTGDGGFAASGGQVTVTLTPASGSPTAPLVWGSTPNFIGNNHALLLGSITADSVVEFANNINFGNSTRTIQVNDNPSSSGDSALLSGVLSGSGFSKTGPGLLTLSAANTYTGATNVVTGILQAAHATSAFGVGSAVTVSSGAELQLNGNSNAIGSLAGSGTVSNDSTTTAATLSIGPGSATTFSGVLQNGSASPLALTIAGNTSLSLTGTNTYTGSTTISAGTLTVGATGSIISQNIGVSPSASFVVNGTISPSTMLTSNGSTTFGPNLTLGIKPRTLAGMTIGSSGIVLVANPTTHANRTVLMTSALAFAGNTGHWQGQLDLAGNDLVVHNTNAAAAAQSLLNITNQIKSGFNAGGTHWNGTGIISSAARSDTTYLTTLGAILNSSDANPAMATFDGQSVTSTDVLVKYTYYGDADLSGKVDGTDYSLIDHGFHTPGANGWINGDFNYDGKIDGSDYSLIDNAFNLQGYGSLASPLNMIAAPTAQISSSQVPEPASGVWIVLSAAATLRRRSHHRRRVDQQ